MSSSDDSNNRCNVHPPTWEDERRNVKSFGGLSPQLVNEFLSSIGYLFGVRIDSDSGPKRTRHKIATVKEGKTPYIEETTEVDTELVTTNTAREANYIHRGWSPSAFLSPSPWTQLRISNNNSSTRPKESITRRIVAYHLQVELLQDDLVPTSEFEAAARNALGRRTRSERFQSVYQLFERWGDVVPLVFDVGTSLAITDLKSNHEAIASQDPMQLTSGGLRRLIELGAAKISTQGIDLSVLRGGLESWMYSSDIPIGRWSQVRVSKAIPITALLSIELQTKLSELYDSIITSEPLVFQEETSSGSITRIIKSVAVSGTDHISALVIACGRRDETISMKHIGTPYHTFILDDGECDYISQVMVWKDSDGICAIQFFTHYGVVSKCYGGRKGMPEIVGVEVGYLVDLEAQMKGEFINYLQARWCEDVQPIGAGVRWGFSEYYGDDSGDRFNDLELMGQSTQSFVRSINIKAGSHNYIDGIQASLTYSRDENGSSVTLEGPYHGGSWKQQGSLQLSPEEYVVAVGVKTPVAGRVAQLSFTTSRGRKLTFSGAIASGQEFVCNAPIGMDGRPMRLYTILGRCGADDYLNGVLFVWTAA